MSALSLLFLPLYKRNVLDQCVSDSWLQSTILELLIGNVQYLGIMSKQKCFFCSIYSSFWRFKIQAFLLILLLNLSNHFLHRKLRDTSEICICLLQCFSSVPQNLTYTGKSPEWSSTSYLLFQLQVEKDAASSSAPLGLTTGLRLPWVPHFYKILHFLIRGLFCPFVLQCHMTTE